MKHLPIGILTFAFAITAAPSLLAAEGATDATTPAPKKPKKTAKKPAKKPKAAVEAPPEKESEKEPEPAPPPPIASPAPAPTIAAPAKDAPAVTPSGDDAAPRPISVAPVLGYGTENLRLGVGIRAGYTLENRVYLGGAFVYHFGRSDESQGLGGKIESSVHFFYPGVEVGYDAPLGPVVVRPYGGVGAIFASVTLKAGGQEKSDTSSSLAFWPGCTVTYAIPRSGFYVGGDAKVVIATEGGDPSFGMFATGGMRF